MPHSHPVAPVKRPDAFTGADPHLGSVWEWLVANDYFLHAQAVLQAVLSADAQSAWAVDKIAECRNLRKQLRRYKSYISAVEKTHRLTLKEVLRRRPERQLSAASRKMAKKRRRLLGKTNAGDERDMRDQTEQDAGAAVKTLTDCADRTCDNMVGWKRLRMQPLYLLRDGLPILARLVTRCGVCGWEEGQESKGKINGHWKQHERKLGPLDRQNREHVLNLVLAAAGSSAAN